MTSKIPIHVSNNRAYVWDVEDLATLRSKHRICGLLSGTLPHLSQQNVFLGAPLLLMPEEVVLLIEKELAILIDDSNAHDKPSRTELLAWAETRDQDMRLHLTKIGEMKESTSMKRSLTEEAFKKRRLREQSRKAQNASSIVEEATNSSLHTPQLENNAEAATPAYPVIIPSLSSEMSWYHPQSHSYETMSAAKAAGIWSYPQNLHERAKCGVFSDFWTRGYYVGGGLKFGGDYLVYPGDPLRYHSHFVATVIDSPTSCLRPMEIVAFGRLGTATKKAHLLCGWDDDKSEVSYYSIEWAGFG